MGKILLLIILVAIAIAWFRARAKKAGTPGHAHAARQAGANGERMVSCAQCAVHLPASEAVFDAAGTAFCGPAHLEQRRAQGGSR